jgi:hypothetical protein
MAPRARYQCTTLLVSGIGHRGKVKNGNRSPKTLPSAVEALHGEAIASPEAEMLTC